MHMPLAMVVAALAASLLLLFQLKKRLFPIVAVVASGMEILLALHIVTFGVRGLNLWLLLGATLVVAGTLIWMKAGGKVHVTAATIVTLVGTLQVFSALG
jgi:hypothetical protein